MAGISLTNAQKSEIRKQGQPPREPMTIIRYREGDIRAGLSALIKRHSGEDLARLPELVREIFDEVEEPI